MGLRFFYKAALVTLITSATLSYAQSGQSDSKTLDEIDYSSDVKFKIINPNLAKQNWVLECQGCHKADASGKGNEMPNMNGEVSKLLSVSGGQEYLYRVNGITHSSLSNEDLVDLMNWMVVEFDPQHIPTNFTGFKLDKLSHLRQTPLDHTILEQRNILTQAIKAMELSQP